MGLVTRLNGAETPMDHRIHLHKNGSTHMQFKPTEKDIEKDAEKCGADVPFREVVRSLLWPANELGRTSHLQLIKLPLPTGYFASNRSKDVDVNIESYVDVDFANSIDDRHSISGYALILAGRTISWQSRSQATVALSTMEVEYMAAAIATQEAFLGLNVTTPVVLREDNRACIIF